MAKIRKNNNEDPITEEMILKCLEKKKDKIEDIKDIVKQVAKLVFVPVIYAELNNLGDDFERFIERFEKIFDEFLNRNV